MKNITAAHTVYFDRKKIAFLPTGIKTSNEKAMQIIDSFSWDQFLSFIQDDRVALHCLSDDPAQSFRVFKRNFQLLKAAGGLVENDLGQWLFIFRNERWDLPKGLVEAGEDTATSAIREVREECGIEAIEIINPLPATYHVYPINHDQWALKETQWYFMSARSDDELRPQSEEGITAAAWFKPQKLDNIMENTYGSIKELIQYCLSQPMTGRCNRA